MADGTGHDHAHAHEAAPAEAPLEAEPVLRADEPAPIIAAAPAPFIAAAPAPLPLVRFAPAPFVAAAPIVRVAPAPYRPAPLAYAPAPVPSYGPAPVPAYGPAPVYQDTPPVYDFAYGVQGDAYTGSAQYAHNENRNGYTTNGEYRVALPDGRTQVVTYNVLDANSGYVADVKYEGQPIAYAPPPRPAYGPVN